MSGPFVCPLCHEALAREARSLVCPNRHTYDIARQGYVNLLLKKPDNLYEDKALFQARRAVYDAGFFDGMVDAVAPHVAGRVLLDAGCGEGSLLARLAAEGRTGIGLDIAKPAVQMAAGVHKHIHWCVGDLCNIPLPDASVDTVLNVLTPANYGEFLRVLGPGGVLIKAVPNAEHLVEIRAMAGKSPYTHTLAETLAIYERHFDCRTQERVRYTVPCDETLARDVFTMTPMTAHEQQQGTLPLAITVDLTVLVGTPLRG